MNKERILAFTDAVVAIIMTIMVLEVKTTRENGWLALRLKASATGRGLKAYRMVSLQHHLC